MKHVNMAITIPEKLRLKIREIKDVNWSEVARRAFEEEIKKRERKMDFIVYYLASINFPLRVIYPVFLFITLQFPETILP